MSETNTEQNNASPTILGYFIQWMIISAFIGAPIIGAYYIYLEDGFSFWMIVGAIFGLLLAFAPVLIIAVIGKFGLPILLIALILLLSGEDPLLTPFMKYVYLRLLIIMILGGIIGAIYGLIKRIGHGSPTH